MGRAQEKHRKRIGATWKRIGNARGKYRESIVKAQEMHRKRVGEALEEHRKSIGNA
jgi:hypothetical protein